MAKILNVRISDEVASRLDRLAERTKRAKSFYVKEMLVEYLDDYEEAYLALDRLNQKNAEFITTEELVKRLKLK